LWFNSEALITKGQSSLLFRITSSCAWFGLSLLFGSFPCIKRIKIASEVAYLQSAPKQSCPDRDAYPDLETATISKQIELERWGWAQTLHLFVFSQNIFYLVHFHAS
jgi:hypothetical protein